MRLSHLLLAVALTSTAQAQPMTPQVDSAQGDGYAVLIISRERLEVATTCEVALYLHDQLTARLYQGQSVSFNLPAGEVSLRLGLTGTGTCQGGIAQLNKQSLQLQAGEIRRYRIAMEGGGLRLRDAPPLN